FYHLYFFLFFSLYFPSFSHTFSLIPIDLHSFPTRRSSDLKVLFVLIQCVLLHKSLVGLVSSAPGLFLGETMMRYPVLLQQQLFGLPPVLALPSAQDTLSKSALLLH